MRKVQMQLGDNTQGKGVISPLTGDMRNGLSGQAMNGQVNGPSEWGKPSTKGFG